MLTARGEPQDRVRGLEIGVDDYLTKPFEPRELLLRIVSVLRRTRASPLGKPEAAVVRFGPFAFSLERGELRAGEEIVRITEREREMLRLLCANAGRERLPRGAVGVRRRGPGADGRRADQPAPAQDRAGSRQSRLSADGPRGRLPADRGRMIARPSFRTLRQLARVRELWRRGARSLADMLPKGLYKRSLLIVILPMVLLQTAVTFAFMQHHWELVTRRLSEAVARDVGALTDLYQRLPPGEDDAFLANLASERFRMDATLLPAGPLPPAVPSSFFAALDPLARTLPSEIKTQLREPFWLDTIGRSGLMEIRVDLGDRVLRLVTRRALAYEANAHIFVLWMLAAMIVLLTVAIIFLRNQIRPILRLARAAEDFGKGRDLEFSPHGAREVRQAGHAFIEMKRRIERATEQRTAMLNGVSHDLRTILTRFKLSLALLDNSADSELLQKDVDEMGQMLEGYLAFARGDASELTTPHRHRLDAGGRARRRRAPRGGNPASDPGRPQHSRATDGDETLRRQSCRERPASRGPCARSSASRDPQFVSIVVDDDGDRHTARAPGGRVPAVLSARRGAQPGRERGGTRPRHRQRHRPLARRRHQALGQPHRRPQGRRCAFRFDG